MIALLHRVALHGDVRITNEVGFMVIWMYLVHPGYLCLSCLRATHVTMRLILGDATARTRASGTVAAFLFLSLNTTGAILLTRTSPAYYISQHHLI